MKIVIRDRNPEFIKSFSVFKYFNGSEAISAQCGDIFQDDNWNCVVSPANSFGFMNGGIDQIYINRYGQQLEDRVRETIKDQFKGELLIGQAFWLYTDSKHDKVLIVAPTMRVPRRIVDPVDVYLATRAAVRCAISDNDDETLLLPGMGTGVGQVNFQTAARNMLIGIRDALEGVQEYKTCGEAYLDNEKFLI